MTLKKYSAIFIASIILATNLETYNVTFADEQTNTVDQDERNLEEIVVSGFRRTGNKDLPASVSVIGAELVSDLGVQHFEELTHAVPNLNWAGGVSRPRYFQVRGIGERSQYEGAPNPSVGFLIDDLDFSGIGGVATLFDTQQVEVLRGPQGTRFGANALAGLIYVKYQEPTDSFESIFTTTLGSDKTQSYGTVFSGPLSDSLNYRAVIHNSQRNGFRDNVFLNRDDTNGRDESNLRLKLAYDINTDWSANLTSMWVDLDNGYDAFAVDNGFTTYSDRPGQDAQRSVGHVLNIAGELSDSVYFESISGVADSDVIFSFDADWGNDEFWDPVIYDFFSRTDRERQQRSQELRFSSTAKQRFDWVTGMLWTSLEESNLTMDDGNYEGFTFVSRVSRAYQANTLALFGDMNFDLSERTTLNTGLRYEQRDADYTDSNGESYSPSENSVGGQIALNYQYSEQTNLYAKVARGYKAGGFNLGLPAAASNNELLFDAEYLWNYELGLKGNYLADRLGLNASLFYMQRKDQQVQTSTQLDPGNPNTFIFFTDNAGKGKNKGLELEANYQVSDAFELYANLGLLDTEINNFSGNSNGRDQAHAPNYTFAAGGRYNFADNWFARIDVSGKDEFYFSDSHDQISQAYSLVNAKLGYVSDNWSITAWGRNLLDEEYAVRGFFFGNEPALDFADKLYTRLGDPRHIGITFEYHYQAR